MAKHNVRNHLGKFTQYKCHETIDLEDWLMFNNDDKKTKVKAVVEYQSGRTETIEGKLNVNGVPDKAFQKRLSAARAFPTVVDVKVEKY